MSEVTKRIRDLHTTPNNGFSYNWSNQDKVAENGDSPDSEDDGFSLDDVKESILGWTEENPWVVPGAIGGGALGLFSGLGSNFNSPSGLLKSLLGRTGAGAAMGGAAGWAAPQAASYFSNLGKDEREDDGSKATSVDDLVGKGKADKNTEDNGETSSRDRSRNKIKSKLESDDPLPTLRILSNKTGLPLPEAARQAKATFNLSSESGERLINEVKEFETSQDWVRSVMGSNALENSLSPANEAAKFVYDWDNQVRNLQRGFDRAVYSPTEFASHFAQNAPVTGTYLGAMKDIYESAPAEAVKERIRTIKERAGRGLEVAKERRRNRIHGETLDMQDMVSEQNKILDNLRQ